MGSIEYFLISITLRSTLLGCVYGLRRSVYKLSIEYLVRLSFWRYGEYWVLSHFHYSQVHSVRICLWVKEICLQIIIKVVYSNCHNAGFDRSFLLCRKHAWIETHAGPSQKMLYSTGISYFWAPQAPNNKLSPAEQVLLVGTASWDPVINSSLTWYERAFRLFFSKE